jgi:DNA integrity scanning protein DisA with diadenylate cyclase activity
LNTLAEVYGRKGDNITVSWREYEKSTNGAIVELDEAIFELSYLIARLAAVDGAVILTGQFELLGFGGEIKLESTEVSIVLKALDLEGQQLTEIPVEDVGTRHRSAYRLCKEMPDALAIVVSQDRGVHFIKNREGTVIYWNYRGA